MHINKHAKGNEYGKEIKPWVNQLDDPTNNRQARRHPLKKHPNRGFTKSKGKKS